MQRLIGGIGEVWLADVCSQYRDGPSGWPSRARPGPRRPRRRPGPGRQPDPDDHPEVAERGGPAGQPGPRQLDHPPGDPRRAREFLPLPTEPSELLESLKRLIRPRAETHSEPGATAGPRSSRSPAPPGGIGCTTLAVNLATTLAKASSQEAILVDFDLMLGSVDACLDIIPDQTLQGVVQNIDRLDLTLLKRSMTRHSSGLYVLPHPVAMEDAAKIDPEALRRLLDMLKAAFPTVIIDTSKGLQSADFVAFEMADVILVVLQLDLTCLRNTARLLQLFQQFEGFTERVQLVVNRSRLA